MNILHYSLGLPPYRSGGLTKYSVDLMLSQAELGHRVTLLYPGSFYVKSKIARNNDYKGIQVFELKRPTPVPLLDGVKEPTKLIPDPSENLKQTLRTLLNNENPDIIHLHTLMGLPNYLLEYAKELGIKICYTTHDYYGICLRVNLIDSKAFLCEGPTSLKCAKCNEKGSSAFRMNLRNLKYLHIFKSIIRKVRPTQNTRIVESINYQTKNQSLNALGYKTLMDNYTKIFGLVDLFLYNSSVSQSIYQRFVPTHNGVILSISHRGIKYIPKKYTPKNSQVIQLLYIGSSTPYKGLPVLIQVLDEIYADGIKNFHLEIWGTETSFEREYTSTKGYFSSEEQHKQVFNEKDLLICPSIWNETFGFVVLEALSQGIPTLVSGTVGAKDVVNTIDPYFVFSNKSELKKKLTELFTDKENLIQFRDKLKEVISESIEMPKHTQDVLNAYSEMRHNQTI